jgi:uncharacterized phage-associated protein
LRLYKLLYFAHGWYLVERREPLVWNDFEAWKDGPVIKVVRDNFATFKFNAITQFARMFDLRQGEEIELPSHLDSPDEAFVIGVIDAYRHLTAKELSLLTHAKGSPWDRVWRAREPVGRFGLRLRQHEILSDFQNLVDECESSYYYQPSSR